MLICQSSSCAAAQDLSCAYLVYSWCFSTVQSTVNQCLFYSLPNRMGGFRRSFHSSADLLEQLPNRKLRVWWYAWQEEASYNLCDGSIFSLFYSRKSNTEAKIKVLKDKDFWLFQLFHHMFFRTCVLYWEGRMLLVGKPWLESRLTGSEDKGMYCGKKWHFRFWGKTQSCLLGCF